MSHRKAVLLLLAYIFIGMAVAAEVNSVVSVSPTLVVEESASFVLAGIPISLVLFRTKAEAPREENEEGAPPAPGQLPTSIDSIEPFWQELIRNYADMGGLKFRVKGHGKAEFTVTDSKGNVMTFEAIAEGKEVEVDAEKLSSTPPEEQEMPGVSE